MTQRQSRTQRQTAFLEAAGELFERMEEWYDKHPEASYGEIENSGTVQKDWKTALQIMRVLCQSRSPYLAKIAHFRLKIATYGARLAYRSAKNCEAHFCRI